MQLSSREAAFLLNEMDEIVNDEMRYPSVQKEAERLREKAESALMDKKTRARLP